MKKLAKYKCDCGHEWSQLIEGGNLPLKHNNIHSDECPSCGSLLFKWINYETDFEKKSI